MPIVAGDLLKFNNVETTDPVAGLVELPYFKTPAYVPNITFATDYDTYIKGIGGRGSQALIRRLTKGALKSVKATVADAFKYNHTNTADDVVVVQIDDVLSKSEEIYEGVEVARQSDTGLEKAGIVLNTVLEGAQAKISSYLVAGALASNHTSALDAENIRERLIADLAALDIIPDTLAVTKATWGILLQLVTSGDFTPNPIENAIRTGIVGFILGMNVVIDENMSGPDYVMYNHANFRVFPTLEKFTIIGATDFDGSYARALMLLGGYAPNISHGSGSWAIKHVVTD